MTYVKPHSARNKKVKEKHLYKQAGRRRRATIVKDHVHAQSGAISDTEELNPTLQSKRRVRGAGHSHGTAVVQPWV